jgi:hypothetical protein
LIVIGFIVHRSSTPQGRARRAEPGGRHAIQFLDIDVGEIDERVKQRRRSLLHQTTAPIVKSSACHAFRPHPATKQVRHWSYVDIDVGFDTTRNST